MHYLNFVQSFLRFDSNFYHLPPLVKSLLLIGGVRVRRGE
jgi:hypothetical protein